jgi:hypothetical protein
MYPAIAQKRKETISISGQGQLSVQNQDVRIFEKAANVPNSILRNIIHIQIETD